MTHNLHENNATQLMNIIRGQALRFEILPQNTRENPGPRKIAKLRLNPLWGKFGKNGDKNDYDFHYFHIQI